MGIESMSNLEDFSVIPIVYQHLLVVNHRGHSSWMLGPILVHYKKEFLNYNFFLSSLVGLWPSLANVQAVGTDGEKSLIDAVHQQFRKAVQLSASSTCKPTLRGTFNQSSFPQQPFSCLSMTYLDQTALMGLTMKA